MSSSSSTRPPVESQEWSDKGWKVYTQKGSIMSSDEIDRTTKQLAIPLPEMIFGDNKVVIEYHGPVLDNVSNIKTSENPKTAEPIWSISFNAIDALDLVDKTGSHMLKVAYSDVWQKARQRDVGMVKPYDWSYTTPYRGSGSSSSSKDEKWVESADITLPYDLLKRPDPIVLFDHVNLFEDELGDNGIVTLNVKVRVMPERLLVLSRLFLRLDDVIFRIRDTRVFIEFDKGVVIREYKEQEADYQTVKKSVPIGTLDFGPFLRDENWVAQRLPVKYVLREALNVLELERSKA